MLNEFPPILEICKLLQFAVCFSKQTLNLQCIMVDPELLQAIFYSNNLNFSLSRIDHFLLALI